MFCFEFFFVFVFCFIIVLILLLFLILFLILFFYQFFLPSLLNFFIIWYLQLCLWTCSSFVNDCTTIIWYAGYKLFIGASLRTAIISKLTFKFALPLIQQNRSFSITDLLVNDVILISSWCYIVLLVASSHQYIEWNINLRGQKYKLKCIFCLWYQNNYFIIV